MKEIKSAEELLERIENNTKDIIRMKNALSRVSESITFDEAMQDEILFERYLDKCNDESEYEEMRMNLERIRNCLDQSGVPVTEDTDLMDYASFYEMAGRIPGHIKVKKKGGEILIVAIGERETRGQSHFHVFRSEKDLGRWKNGACLCFAENKYFDHGNNRETLTRDELKALTDCLKSKPAEGLAGKNYWQYLINLWNGNNYDFRIDINTPMPDYDYRTITRYKEKGE